MKLKSKNRAIGRGFGHR